MNRFQCLESIEIPSENLVIVKELGEGQFGKVFEGMRDYQEKILVKGYNQIIKIIWFHQFHGKKSIKLQLVSVNFENLKIFGTYWSKIRFAVKTW